MTLDDLLIDCCTRLNYAPALAAVDDKVKARLTAFLNQTQLEILGQPSYKTLLRIETLLTTQPGVSAYGLPTHIERIIAIPDPTRQRRLDVISTDAYRRTLPDPTRSQGTPTAYAFDGWASVQRQPEGRAVFVYSANVADDGTKISCKAVAPGVAGANSGDVWLPYEATLSLTGAGVELIPASAAAAYVTDVALSKPVSGAAVDLYADKPPTIFLGRIAQGQTRGRFAQVYLAPTPSGVYTYTVYGERPAAALVAPTSESVLPPRFHYILAAGARMKEYELRGDAARLAVATREYQVALGYLNAWVADQVDAGAVMTPGGHAPRHSTLGPWFPAEAGYRR